MEILEASNNVELQSTIFVFEHKPIMLVFEPRPTIRVYELKPAIRADHPARPDLPNSVYQDIFSKCWAESPSPYP